MKTRISLAILVAALTGASARPALAQDDEPPTAVDGEDGSGADDSADDSDEEDSDEEDSDGVDDDPAAGDEQPASEDPDEELEEDDSDEEDEDLEAEEGEDPAMRTSEVVVAGQAEEVFRAGGSVHRLGERQLAELAYNDPMAALASVPGVYVRSEEGFGLRPNIGLRGGSSERSRRITLMEDGVLAAPAPYAAPAAYYFPLMARVTGIEVSAGPAAILYGPNTVGGAIDLETRRIPTRRQGHVNVSLGNTWYGRMHAHYGDSNRWGGFLLEAVHLRSSGFHELDAAPGVSTDTGFHRTDVVGRWELHGDLDDTYYHRLELSVGLGLEQSNETYLGLSTADFATNPNLRYAASQLDRMEWWRTRVHLRYEIESDDVQVRVTAYRHDFERTWYRLDHFCDNLRDRPAGERDECTAAVGFERILGLPNVYPSQFGRLTGAIEPQPGDAPLIVLNNNRVYASQGVQADARARAVTGDFTHRLRLGARVHYDDVARSHTGDTYQLERRQMVLQTGGLELDRNQDSAWAVSAYASWGVTWEGLTVTPGVRTELIWTTHEDIYSGNRVFGEQLALLPGLGVQYTIVPELAVFAGAHLGYSPVAPGSGPEVLPETAWNYELGVRYGRVTDRTYAQVTGFLSDYTNLAAQCSLATGCSLDMIDQQFNAGAVLVAGLEADVRHTFVVDELEVPVAANYTFTWSHFQSAFESPNPQLGVVEVGDQLPYVPEHQFTIRLGAKWRMLQLFVNGAFVAAMRDVAGQAPRSLETADEWTDDVFLLDARVAVEVVPGTRLYVRGENLTNQRPITTRRPWGVRGARPLLVQGGVEIDFR